MGLCSRRPALIDERNFCELTFSLWVLSCRRRHTADGSDNLQTQGQQQQQQQQIVPVQDSYMQNRSEALHNVESTITELSNIFTQLATMVSQQGELAIRYHLHLQ